MSDTVLIMRVCRPDMTSHGGFVWPESGPVEAPDWSPEAECGHGLHGWLWGDGDITTAQDVDKLEGARWLVVEVAKSDVVDLVGKVKFPRGTVVHVGDVHSAAKLVAERAPADKRIIGGTATAGFAGTATAGTRGTATAGDAGTATAGDLGTISIEWYDSKRGAWRKSIAEIDSQGEYKPGFWYHVVDGRITVKGPVVK